MPLKKIFAQGINSMDWILSFIHFFPFIYKSLFLFCACTRKFGLSLEAKTEEEKDEERRGYDRNGFNQYRSDRIPLDRTVPDNRHYKSVNIPMRLAPRFNLSACNLVNHIKKEGLVSVLCQRNLITCPQTYMNITVQGTLSLLSFQVVSRVKLLPLLSLT